MKNTFDKIWEKTKLANPNTTFIKKGDTEILIAENKKGFVVKCKAGDIQR